MILPRRLFITADGHFCEADDPKMDKNFHPEGYPIPDQEAERIGLKAYLDKTGWGAVASKPDEAPPEDMKADADAPDAKAVDQHDVEDKGLHIGHEESADAPQEAQTPEAEEKEEPGPGLHIDTGARRSRRS